MPRPASGRRQAPQRHPGYSHLSLDGLRSYREALRHEEGRVSYWRRIVQARLDVLRAGNAGKAADIRALGAMLSDERAGTARRALVEVMPSDDIPPLPELAELWARMPAADDAVGRTELITALVAAEAQLSDYRNALHRRLGEATGELIARYRETPSLSAAALPFSSPRQRLATGT